MSILWFASKNENKIAELNAILANNMKNIVLKSLNDLDDLNEIDESGFTIEENSLIKAKYLAKKINQPVIADDSGLEILALNNFPGVNSKRWAGNEVDAFQMNKLLLQKCSTLKDRNAQMKTVVTYYEPQTSIYKQFTGILKGEISFDILGNNGFSYDMIFYLPNKSKTLAQLSLKQKNKISHRSIAINKFIQWIESQESINEKN